MFKAQQIIPAYYISKATSPKQKISDNMDYGYGWIMQQLYGHQTVEHSGAISGYTSNIVMFPEEKIGIVILTNQSISNISNRITDNIVRRIFDINTEPTSQTIRYERTPEPPTLGANTILNLESKPSHPLEEFQGTYFHPGYGQIHINFTDSTLYADFPYTKFRLQHREANTFIDFFTEEIPLFMGNYMNFNFQVDSYGLIDAFLLNLDNTPVVFKKIND